MRKIDVGILKSCLGLLSRLRLERRAKKVFQELDDRDVLAVQQLRVLILEREYIPDHIFGGLRWQADEEILGKKQQKSADQR